MNLSQTAKSCSDTSSLSHGKISRFFHTSSWIRYARLSHQYVLIQPPFSQETTRHPICASVKSSVPSRRKYEHRHVSAEEVTGNHFTSTNTDIQRSLDEMIESDERSAHYEKNQQLQSDLINTPGSELTKINEHVRSHLPTNRRSSSPGEYWHCDTIPLGKCWDGFHEALVLVDDFCRKIYVYAMKSKRQECVAEALTKHFNKVQLPQSWQRHLNFYTHRLILRSDQGSEFTNTTVQSFCNKYMEPPRNSAVQVI